MQLAVSRLPHDITYGTSIEEQDTGPGGTYARLEEAGYLLDRYVEYVTARLPSSDEATTLCLDYVTPILAVTRVATARSGRIAEINDMVLPADRYELMYELPALD